MHMVGKICGTGSCVPEHILDNGDLSNMVETSDAWIFPGQGAQKAGMGKDFYEQRIPLLRNT